MKTISGHTDLYAILGNPIVHSMSPVIMNRNFERNDLDKVFLALKSDLTDFDTVFPVLIGCGFKGYVFTMPVKEIAAMTGFHNLSYFTRQFRRIFIQPPATYRRHGG